MFLMILYLLLFFRGVFCFQEKALFDQNKIITLESDQHKISLIEKHVMGTVNLPMNFTVILESNTEYLEVRYDTTISVSYFKKN